MKFHRTLRKKIVGAGRAFLNAMNKNRGVPPFDPGRYYVTLDGKICSMRPYHRWREARAAAKRFSHRAFIMKGSTLNRIVKDYNWKAYKEVWGAAEPK